MSLRQLLALVFVLFLLAGCSTAVESAVAQSPRPVLSPLMHAALAREFGAYEGMATWQEMMRDLQTADVVCIGEAHYDARDMETAFELTRELAQRRKIVLAVERFSHVLQPELAQLDPSDAETSEVEVEAILASKEYQTVWGSQSFAQTGYPVNSPSRPMFEAMVKWATRARIPIIALDVSLAEREQGLGEDMAFRNAHWKKQIEKFWKQEGQENYQIVVIGGINHMTNEHDSFPSRLRAASPRKIVSLGQRDAMYHYFSSTQVEVLAKSNQIDDLIVRNPQFALVNVKGVATILNPPDYWITFHTPQSEK